MDDGDWSWTADSKSSLASATVRRACEIKSLRWRTVAEWSSEGENPKDELGEKVVCGVDVIIRSSIMSHITFKMCQFVLIIYLRD